MGRYSLVDAKNRDEVCENVRVMDDAGYARKTTEARLEPEIRRFGRRQTDTRTIPVTRRSGRR